jgi:hypothetical protein
MAGDIILEGTRATEAVADIQERRDAAIMASATPLPGPLADAFAVAPDIKVGSYSVRPFLEGDFELLKALSHPLYDMLIAMFSGKPSEADYLNRGPQAWELCVLFTRSFDEAEKMVAEGVLKDLAQMEFKKQNTAVVVKLHSAIIKQVMLASSTAIAYGSSEDGEGSKKNV